jgi:hypothetical protein
VNKNITIVTGLWNLDRASLSESFKRSYKDYKKRFFELLKTDAQMCIWISKDLEDEVLKEREGRPTKIYFKELSDFKTWNPFFYKIQEIRNNKDWRGQVGWLEESPQANLEYYNAMMFTKMFMVNDSAILNPFNSEYFFWIDGGITNTVHKGYFQHDNVFDNLENFVKNKEKKFIQIAYPYIGAEEVHGFERKAFAKYCGVDYVDLISRGGFFGGKKDLVHEINTLYYDTMKNTLEAGFMGADECLFTILGYNHKDIIYRYEIEGNGLVWPFFEHLKEYKQSNTDSKKNVGLYVITFNSPKQFETLITSIIEYDISFLEETEKILLDNSTDLTTYDTYSDLCKKYGFTHIKRDNIGICGGRQFIAEDADFREFDYYLFFEDDMFFYPKKGEVCKNGFNRYVDKLFDKVIKIIKKESFDFLKLCYSEFFGDNGTQWAWYNVPQDVREKFWPNNKKLPETGTDINAPKTVFNNIKSYQGLPYVDGEVYYSNWPQIVSREGNKKMFINTKFTHPFEQTWMSFMYQETKKGVLKPGLLLISPTEHNRFDHYDGKIRREN